MSSHPTIGLYGFWGGFDTDTVPFFNYLTNNYNAIFTTDINNQSIDLLIVSVFAQIPPTLRSKTTLLLAFEDYTRWSVNYKNPYPLNVDYAIVNNRTETIPFTNRCKQALHSSLSIFSHYPIEDTPILFKEERQKLSVKDKSKFCSFVFSNAYMGDEGVKERYDIFKLISHHYKKVDSAGSFANNMPNGERAPRGEEFDKWIRQYKFSIYGENMIRPGYYTEKVLYPYKNQTVPIYNSHSDILEFFNHKSMIFCNGKTEGQILKEVIEIDTDPHKYEEMLREPVFIDNKVPDCFSIGKGYEMIDDIMVDLRFCKNE